MPDCARASEAKLMAATATHIHALLGRFPLIATALSHIVPHNAANCLNAPYPLLCFESLAIAASAAQVPDGLIAAGSAGRNGTNGIKIPNKSPRLCRGLLYS